MLYCNQFIEKIPVKAPQNSRDNGEEKTDDVTLIQKKQKMLRQTKILHHFTRYMTHMQSQRLERDARKSNCVRILEGLRSSQEGELVWLRQNTTANPLFERVDDDPLPTIGTKEDALIADYQLPIEESTEFITDAFNELEKSRTLLKWTYPFALFEFDDKIVKGKKASPNRTPARLETFKVDFFFLQANLEYNTESLSNLVARKRMRGTKQEISLATFTLRAKRIQFEDLLQEYLTPPNLEEIISLPSEETKKETAVNGTNTNVVTNVNLSTENNLNNKSVYRAGSNLSLLFAGPGTADNTVNTGNPSSNVPTRVPGPTIPASLNTNPSSFTRQRPVDAIPEVSSFLIYYPCKIYFDNI